MKAIMVSELGGPEVLRIGETQIPQPGPGEALVRVLTAGVGPWDAGLRSGRLSPPQLPFTPGAEFAGLIVGDTGAEAAFEDGEPVYGYPGLTGCYAEYVTCPLEQLAPVPAGLDAGDAGAVPVDALTAHQGLTDVLQLTDKDVILIAAAAGGLGHFAVQIARGLGARVIGTASPQHHDFVHKLGAEVVLDHTQANWPEQVRAETDGGVHKVLACAAPTLTGAAHSARDGGIVATPVHADEYPEVQRVRWQNYSGQPSGSRLIKMAPWFDDGTLEVHIVRRYYFADAPAAHATVEQGHTRGKVLLIVDEDLAAQQGV
ncbi:MAG TPA: NADP-dependent oxidoreductase [Streptosporangiaceae bacterium]|nr:NADP-dependent oxidoreductase [Streptosporangiaceae bacterium]